MPKLHRNLNASTFLLGFSLVIVYLLLFANCENVQNDKLSDWNPFPMPVNQQIKMLQSAFEHCIGELRKQAVSIQRLTEITESQTSKIEQLDEIVEEQQHVINHMKDKMQQYSDRSDFSVSETSGKHFKTCDEIKTSHSPASGIYSIDPDGHGGDAPIQVYCNMTTGATLIPHDCEEIIKVTSCDNPGCFNRVVDYRNVTFKQLVGLIQSSTMCQQELLYDSCTEESFKMKRMNGTENYSSWWRNRNGTLRYFGTGNEKNNGVGQLVSQVITNSDDLPVIEINFGPERDGHGLCSTQFQLGKLVCFGYQDNTSSNGVVARRGSLPGNNRGSSRRPSRNRGKPKNPKGSALDTMTLSHTGCTIDLHASPPQYPPHLIDRNNNIILPTLHGRTRIITLNENEKVTIGCSGKNSLKLTGNPVDEAFCISNSILLWNQSELTFPQLGCTRQNKEVLDEVGVCANGRGTLVRVGWKLDFKFLPLYDMCHDKATTVNYFSTHVIVGRSMDADDKSNTRPSFRQSDYYPGLDVNAAFGPSQQNKTITRTVGSEILATKYFNREKNFFLARGHLAPDGDFIDAASQDASYYYLNMAPQWQSFNGGNWNLLETAVRQIAIARDLDLKIYTGTFGIMSLLDVKGIKQPLYLASDKNNNSLIPVPMYYWKVIHEPISDTATAVIGINNPHLERITPQDILCPDVCNQIAWVKWKLTDIEKGYTFCCTAQGLHKVVPYAPNLTVSLFL